MASVSVQSGLPYTGTEKAEALVAVQECDATEATVRITKAWSTFCILDTVDF